MAMSPVPHVASQGTPGSEAGVSGAAAAGVGASGSEAAAGAVGCPTGRAHGRRLVGGTRRAFTLVELLVVIGIIAVLVGILLPVLGRVRDQGRTIACTAQLRNHIQGLLTYAAENKGVMPNSFAWFRAARSGGVMTGAPLGLPTNNNWGNVSGNSYPGYAWASGFHWAKTISDMALKTGEGGMYPIRAHTSGGVPPAMKLSRAFVCPEVATNSFYDKSINSYGFNPVVLVNEPFEVNPNGSTANYRAGVTSPTVPWSPGSPGTGGTTTPVPPARLSQLLAETAVLWDTQVVESGPPESYTPANIFGGFGMSGIDGGQLGEPQKGFQRYRGLNPSAIEPAELPDKPIILHTKKMEAGKASFKWVNNDPHNGFLVWPDQVGNARFRHGRDKLCNVAFADGSVRTLRLDVNRVAYLDKAGEEVAVSDFLRRYLLIKPPSALPLPQQIPGP